MTAVQLDSVVTIVGGGTPSKSRPEYYANGTIPWVTPKDMKCWDIADAIDRITQDALDESATRLVPQDSVLLVVRSGILKHSLPIAINRVPVALNQDMKALICDSTILAEYLARFLQWSAPQILSQARATTADNIPVDGLRKLRFHLPPLPEQRRIAALLDKADAIRRKRLQAIRLADDLLRSAFLDMFGDPVTNPKGWPVVNAGDLFGRLDYGTSGKCSNVPSASALPVLRIPNIADGEVSFNTLKYAELSGAEVQKLRLSDGDLLFVRTNGNPEFIGRCAVFERGAPMLFASYLIRARLRPDCTYRSRFLRDVVSSPSYRSRLVREARTTAGNYNISAEGLRRLLLIAPPVDAQDRYLRFAARVAAARPRLRDHVAASDGLLHSLVQRAFRGDL